MDFAQKFSTENTRENAYVKAFLVKLPKNKVRFEMNVPLEAVKKKSIFFARILYVCMKLVIARITMFKF